VKQNPGRSNLRYFAPPLLVLVSAIGIVLAMMSSSRLTGTALGSVLQLGFAPLSAYLAAVMLVALSARDKPKIRVDLATRIALTAVLPTMHFCWGIGFW